MKRRIAILTAFMIFALALSSFAAPFSDMPKSDSEYYSAVEYAAAKGILNGDGGKLMADSPVTRAQAAAFLTRALGLSQKADISSLKDVKSGDWYADSAAAVMAAGLIPSENGSFMPDKQLTKKEAAIILSKAYRLGFEEKDMDKLLTVLSGSPEKAGNLSALISRGDFILWLYNAVKAAPSETASEAPSQNASESASAPTEAESKNAYELAAEAAMRLALGLRADGTSYIEKNVVYRDGGHSMDWKDIGGSSGNKRPSTPSKPVEKPTEPKDEPTEPNTEEPTEPQTEPPEDYTGPIDNDKDNVIEDPFGGDDEGNNDAEDDFNFNDADDPTDKPSEKPSEEQSEKPSEDMSEEPSDESSEDMSEEPSDESSEDMSEEPSDESSEDMSEEPSDESSEDMSEEPSDESSEDMSEETSEESSEEPSEEAGEPVESESTKSVLFGGFDILAVFKRVRWFA